MINRMIRRLRNPHLTISLYKKTLSEMNDLGNQKESWEFVQELTGIFNEPRKRQNNDEGEYDDTAGSDGQGDKFLAYFLPFDISNTYDYRIKCVINTGYVENVEWYDVLTFNPNLYRGNKQSHVEMRLRLI